MTPETQQVAASAAEGIRRFLTAAAGLRENMGAQQRVQRSLDRSLSSLESAAAGLLETLDEGGADLLAPEAIRAVSDHMVAMAAWAQRVTPLMKALDTELQNVPGPLLVPDGEEGAAN